MVVNKNYLLSYDSFRWIDFTVSCKRLMLIIAATIYRIRRCRNTSQWGFALNCRKSYAANTMSENLFLGTEASPENENDF